MKTLVAHLTQWTLRMHIWSQMTSVKKSSSFGHSCTTTCLCLIDTWYKPLDFPGSHDTQL